VYKGVVLRYCISFAASLLQFFITYSKMKTRGQVKNSSTTGGGKSERITIMLLR
jgi:hypothetical protein